MLKKTLLDSFKELITNRYLTILTGVMAVLTIGFIIYIAFTVRPSDLQLVTHYSAYGITHLYRDQWYYLLGFGAFAVLVAFFHTALSIKLYLAKGHPLALLVAWTGIAIILFAWATAIAIINVWSPV